MYSKYYLFTFLISLIKLFIIISSQIVNEPELNSLPEYNEQWFRKESEDLRKRFFKKKIEKEKVLILDQLLNDTIYVDGIPHVDVKQHSLQRDKINKMENGFKALLGMKGVKYTYKRGFHWRTWRKVDYEGNKSVICYRCNTAVNMTCKNCLSSGYWVIEEKPPPCPYEILSMPNNNQICAVHFNQYNDFRGSCPTLINLSDILATCNNPMETQWKITRKYNDLDSESTITAICNGRESCQILTIYTVLPDSILFKIINSTNHIIYSRMMRSGNKNYACVEDCGTIDNNTKALIKNEKPLVLNLLGPVSHKNKREDITGTLKTSTDQKLCSESPKRLLFLSKYIQNYYDKGLHKTLTDVPKSDEKWVTINPIVKQVKFVTKTTCNKLQDAFNENDDDSETEET